MKKEFRVPMSRPSIGNDEKKSVLKVLETNWPSQGKVTEEFENRLSNYLSSNVIVVNNGVICINVCFISKWDKTWR